MTHLPIVDFEAMERGLFRLGFQTVIGAELLSLRKVVRRTGGYAMMSFSPFAVGSDKTRKRICR